MHPSLLIKLGDDMLRLVHAHGGEALFGILVVEEAGVPLPLPGDLMLLYAGVLATQNLITIWAIYFWSILGVMIGSTFLFFLFEKGGRAFAYRYGKYILLPKSRIHRLEEFFAKHGKKAVLVGRFIPGLRVFVSAVAGLAGTLSYRDFIIQVVVASFIWISLFTGIGYYLGKEYLGIVRQIEGYGYILFIIFFGYIIYEIIRNRKEK